MTQLPLTIAQCSNSYTEAVENCARISNEIGLSSNKMANCLSVYTADETSVLSFAETVKEQTPFCVKFQTYVVRTNTQS